MDEDEEAEMEEVEEDELDTERVILAWLGTVSGTTFSMSSDTTRSERRLCMS